MILKYVCRASNTQNGSFLWNEIHLDITTQYLCGCVMIRIFNKLFVLLSCGGTGRKCLFTAITGTDICIALQTALLQT